MTSAEACSMNYRANKHKMTYHEFVKERDIRRRNKFIQLQLVKLFKEIFEL